MGTVLDKETTMIETSGGRGIDAHQASANGAEAVA